MLFVLSSCLSSTCLIWSNHPFGYDVYELIMYRNTPRNTNNEIGHVHMQFLEERQVQNRNRPISSNESDFPTNYFVSGLQGLMCRRLITIATSICYKISTQAYYSVTRSVKVHLVLIRFKNRRGQYAAKAKFASPAKNSLS